MCGRISQKGDYSKWLELTRWNPSSVLNLPDDVRYNVPPGSRPIVLHRIGDGAKHADRLFWGYKPAWSKRPPISNARLDAMLKRSGFWMPLLSRRVIVPADGWFEWVGKKGDKQPWFISAKDKEPILMAGITAWEPGKEVLAETGFAIVTDDVAGGMIDIHDRRPITLTPDDALAWLDLNASIDDALQLLSTPRPESAFQWWEVTRKMGSSKYQQSDASLPLRASK